MDDLFDLWQAEHSIATEMTESAAAVHAALTDMEQGDTGRPLEEFIAELRRQ